jgi:hypothetical protein
MERHLIVPASRSSVTLLLYTVLAMHINKTINHESQQTNSHTSDITLGFQLSLIQLHAFERPAVATELILKCKHFCHYKEELCGFRIRRLKIQPTTIDPCRNPIPGPATTLRTLLCSTFTIDEGHKSNPTAVTASKLIHTQDHSCASLAHQWMGPSARL